MLCSHFINILTVLRKNWNTRVLFFVFSFKKDCTNLENIYSSTEILKLKTTLYSASHNFEFAEEMEQFLYREINIIISSAIIIEELTILSLRTNSHGESMNTTMLCALLKAVYIYCATAKCYNIPVKSSLIHVNIYVRKKKTSIKIIVFQYGFVLMT